ncbi:hypothetical protein G3N57_00070 [Paraburkholderia sp. Se-20369]|nr:hypothetical protein [Paraburkholderia sp. Se-20369]RQQ00445.1 hypothetical protein DF164_29850 [Burkholderia stagnalis]RQY68758.1 hypothetical protein DF110_19165 [Burkholderia stagnalis]
MTSRTHNDGDVLLDDGIYFIENNPAAARDGNTGRLMRRCDRTSRDAGAVECVGVYEVTQDGKWRVAITSYYDARTDSETHEVGAFENRLDAICTLWKSRHDAIGRYAN